MSIIRFAARLRAAANRWTLQELNAPLTHHLLAGDR